MNSGDESPSKLPAIGFVEALNRSDREALAAFGTFAALKTGEIVIRESMPQESLFFLLAGSLHAKRNEGGREVLLGEIKVGEWFGEVNIFDPGDASATVRAVGPGQIWSITKSQLEKFLNTHPKAGNVVLIGIATILSRRLRGITTKLMGRSEYAALLGELRLRPGP